MSSVWGSHSVTWQGWEPWELRGECLPARAPSDGRGVIWGPDAFTSQEEVSFYPQNLDESEKHKDSNHSVCTLTYRRF